MDDVRDALAHARKMYAPGALLCIAGSLYLIGAARQILCGDLVPE